MRKNSTPEDFISNLKDQSDENDSGTSPAADQFMLELFLQLKNLELRVADRVVLEVYRLTGL